MKMFKKYRDNPKRMVLTIACQKKITLNRLGDLVKRNVVCALENGKDELRRNENTASACIPDNALEQNRYVLESEKQCKKEKGVEKCNLEASCGNASQILEGEQCYYAFKASDKVVKEGSTGETIDGNVKDRNEALRRNALKREKSMQGGIVCEKSYKILLCDAIVTLFVSGLAVFVAIKVIKKSKKD